MKTAVVSFTRHGIALAGRVVAALPGARLFVPEKFAGEAERAAPGAAQSYSMKTGELLGQLFTDFEAIVAILSLGALVRQIAPYLDSKQTDPAIVVLDEGGRFVIPALSGHLGGANALAGRLAAALGARAVLTTSSDSRETLCVDLLGREFGWTCEATHDALVHASAAVVNDDPVALVQEAGRRDWWPNHANGRNGPLPANVTVFERLEAVDPARFSAVLWISRRDMPSAYADALTGKCVIYRPGHRRSAGGLPGNDCRCRRRGSQHRPQGR
jgi:cobalt-precorrin 5A hydrolase